MGPACVQAKTEKLEKTKALRQAQQEVSLLVNMVRLADYMCCEGAMALLLRTLENLRDAFETKALLLTQLSFDIDPDGGAGAPGAEASGTELGSTGTLSGMANGENGEVALGAVSFHANEEAVRQALTSDIVDALNEVIKQLPRLPQQDALKPLFVAEQQAAHAAAGGTGHVGSLLRVGPEMTTMLMGYRPLQKARLGLGQVVSKAFREARAAAHRYAGLRVIASFSAAFDGAAYRQQQRDVVQFRRDMALLR